MGIITGAVAVSYSSGGDNFILGFTILTYSIETNPHGGINEYGCFGEAFHLLIV